MINLLSARVLPPLATSSVAFITALVTVLAPAAATAAPAPATSWTAPAAATERVPLQISRAQATKRALQRLAVAKTSAPVRVYALKGTRKPGDRIAQAGRSAGKRSARSTFDAPLIVKLRKRSFVYYADDAPHTLYQHRGRIVIVPLDGSTPTVRHTTFAPLVNGVAPSFLRSQGAYLSNPTVFVRDYSAANAGDATPPAAPDADVELAVARTLAEQGTCVVRAAGTGFDFGGAGSGFVTSGRSASAIGSVFTRLAAHASGLVNVTWSPRKSSASAFIDALIADRGCRSILVVAAGGGYLTGPPAVSLGTTVSGGRRAHVKTENLTAADLSALVSRHPGVAISLVLDAPYTGRFTGRLAAKGNVEALLTAGGSERPALAYLPGLRSGSIYLSNQANPRRLQETSNQILTGLSQFLASADELRQYQQSLSQGKARSLVGWMLVRASKLGTASAPDIDGVPKPFTYSPVAVTAPSATGAPTAEARTLTVDEDGSEAVTFAGTDPAGLPLTFEVVDEPAHGVVAAVGGGVRYTPTADYAGSDSFTYRAVTSNGTRSAPATVSVTVTPVNDGPVGDAFSTTVDEDATSTTIAAPGLLAAASDVDGDPLAAVPAAGAGSEGGDFDVHADGSFDYDPSGAFEDLAADAERVDTFAVTVEDSSGLSATVTIRVRVVGDDDGPLIDVGIASAAYTEDAPDEVLAPSLTVTDADDALVSGASVVIAGGEDSDVLTWTVPNGSGITASYDGATRTLTASGSASKAAYRGLLRSVAFHTDSDTPDESPRTVTFTVTDPAGADGADDLILAVTAHDDLSEAIDDTATVAEDAGDTAIGVLVNDVDPDGAGPAVDSITQPATGEGTATLVGGNVSYTPAANFSGATTFAYTLIGGSTATVTIIVTAVNDAPALAGGTGSASFTEGDASGVIVHSGVTISDVDSADLTGATVSIGTGLDAADDRLTFTDTDTIRGSYEATTGVLTLAGTATVTAYRAALRSVHYRNVDTSDPDTTTRVVGFQVTDGSAAHATSNTITSDVTVTAVNDRPTVTAGSITSFSEGGSPVVVDGTVTVADVDNATLAGAAVEITGNHVAGEDVLAFTDTADITGSYDGATGTLTLTGSDTLAGYRAALRSVTYANADTDNPSTASRTVTFAVTDGALTSTGATSTVDVVSVNSAPVLAGGGNTVAYSEDDAATVVNDSITVSDTDDADLESATVAITTNLDATDDALVFVDTAAITGTYDPATGVLTMSGAATKASYQTVLRSVRYVNSNHAAPATSTRIVDFAVNDGEEDSNVVTSDITVEQVADVPTLTSGTANTQTFAENGTAIVVDDAIVVADVDSTHLTGAVVSIADGRLGADALSLPVGGSLSGAYDVDTGVLTISGVDTVANYQSALRTVTFSTAGDSPGTSRTVEFTVTDGTATSAAATHGVTLTPVNDPPSLTSGGALAYTENGPATAISPTLGLSDPDSDSLTGATVAITGGFRTSEDVLSLVDTADISGSYDSATGILTLTGAATVADYRAVLRAVRYSNTSETPSTATRSVTYTVSDGTGSDSVTATVTVAAVDDAPVADDESFSGASAAIGNTSLVGDDPTDGAPDPAGPQKTVNANILSGDTDPEGATLSVVPGTFGTNDGGSVTVQADGDFTFTPAVSTSCSDHSDFFDYTVSDGAIPTPGTDTGRVTIAITDCVWYVDNTATAGGNGTSGTPYDTLAEADTAATTISAYVHVDGGDGTTTGLTGGMKLLDGQRLVGAAEDLTVAGTTLETGVDADRPAISGTVTLAAGNTVEGLAVTTTGASAIDGGAGDDSGTLDDLVLTSGGATGIGMSLMGTMGIWNISNITITATTGAQGIFVNTAGRVNFISAGTISVTAAGPAVSVLSTTVSGVIDTTTSTGGSYGWAINAVTGSLDLGTGTVSGHTSTEIAVTAGTGNVTYAGTLGNGTGTSAVVQNRTTGAVTLSGDITDSNDVGGGITLAGNSGGSTTFSGVTKTISVSSGSAVNAAFTGNHTLSLTGGGLDIDAASSGAGIVLSGSTGTVVVSGTGNTIDTATGTALSINGPDIGAAGVTLQRISSNAAANGILLADTGAAGGLTVTGSGATNSGGIINASTGAGVSLTNTRGVDLTSLAVRNGGNDGIRGAGVNGLTMTGTTVTGNGNAAGEDGIDLTELSGVVTIDNAAVTGNYEDDLAIVNDAATISALTIDGGTFANNSSTGGGDGIRIENNGTGATTGTIQDATFTNNHGDHVQIATDDTNTTTQNVVLNGNTLTSTGGSGTLGGGIALSAGGGAVQTVTLDDNDIDYAQAAAISFTTSAVGAPATHWTVNNNRIGDTAVVKSGSASNSGLLINIVGEGTANFLITDNTIRQTDFTAIDAVQNDGSGAMNVTMKGNQLLEPGTSINYAYGIRFVVGSDDGDNGVSCLDLGDPTTTPLKNRFFGAGNSIQGYQDVRVRMAGDADLRLVGYTGGAHDNAAVNAWMQSRNNIGGTPTTSSSQFDADSFYLPASICPR